MSNDNYITALTNFNILGEGTLDQYYVAPVGVALGGTTFVAGALFKVVDNTLAATERAIWSNRDNDTPTAGNGWSISMVGSVLTMRCTNAAGVTVAVTADLSEGGEAPFVDQWLLVHLVADTAGNLLRMFVQGTEVGSTALVGALASTDLAKVGVLGADASPVFPALSDIIIAGVFYQDTFTAAVDLPKIATHFENCQQAFDMAKPVATVPTVTWGDRWSSRLAVDPAAPGGTLIDSLPVGGKTLTVLPAAIATWLPSDGADNLTRVGVLRLTSVKDNKWYTGSPFINGVAQFGELNLFCHDILAGSSEVFYMPLPDRVITIIRIKTTLQGNTVGGGDVTLTTAINAVDITGGVVTIANASTVGTNDEATPTALNVTDGADDHLRVTVGGGGTGAGIACNMVIEFTY